MTQKTPNRILYRYNCDSVSNLITCTFVHHRQHSSSSLLSQSHHLSLMVLFHSRLKTRLFHLNPSRHTDFAAYPYFFLDILLIELFVLICITSLDFIATSCGGLYAVMYNDMSSSCVCGVCSVANLKKSWQQQKRNCKPYKMVSAFR